MQMTDKFFQPLIFVLLTAISFLNNDFVSWVLYGLYFFFAVIKFIAKKNVDRQLTLCVIAFMAYGTYYLSLIHI